ncbi:hypothetical protein DYBT9275_00713 [Dyadobacter sp. CECT 9275]|uniref:LysM domain-containing protein n=1 Tax=Dyadobacter helix TaxID=2822344 RepID=A0A916NAL3_9BACT|nr:LysM peptidoglycan-binding domain-containing protein [Dyadobacter sp. CECT 9275]CAG4991256.1 hypothetical protein DYBT9275_00713 [Dyadobacter sp. CECT 9275]
MTSVYTSKLRELGLTITFFLLIAARVMAQEIPEIPSSVSFGGVTVKFDRNAQNIIEEDIKSLMGNKKFWEEKMDRAILHFPIVEGILMDEEVPIDFKYLAVQESSFKPDVVSSSNAVGYWQFKPETARELNLRVDDEVDERKNISSSTHAAAWYLKKNNQQFNNWVSTLYSYYLGAGGVKKIVPPNWTYAREVTLTGKTDRYVLRFFAHKIALEAGIERHRSANTLVLFESETGKGQTFDEIARSLGVNVQDLQAYNRWFKGDRVPSDREYYMIIPSPANQASAVRTRLSSPVAASQPEEIVRPYEPTGFPVLKVSKEMSEKNGHTFYQINGLPGIQAKQGDKPKTLASEGNLRAPRFMRHNDMLRDMALVPGNIYYLAKKNKKAATPFHTARPGDTWHGVSQQYGIRLVNLLKYNRTISRNFPIETGQVLWLTKRRPRKQPVEIVPPKSTTPAPVPAEEPVIAAAPAPVVTPPVAEPAVSVPEKRSGRKKYKPVLVENKDSGKGNQSFESEPSASGNVPPNEADRSAGGSKSQSTNDRVVIINQDNPSAPASNPTLYTRSESSKSAKSPQSGKPDVPVGSGRTGSAAASAPQMHQVAAGETLFSISRKYNVPVRELLAINDMTTSSKLVTGQRIKVPQSAGAPEAGTELLAVKPEVRPVKPAEAARAQESEAIKTVEAGSDFHIVQPGQTYYSISKMYGLSVNELLAINGLRNTEHLEAGQKLRVTKEEGSDAVPSRLSSAVSNTDALIHTVAAGETLFGVAQLYKTSVNEVKKLNNLSGNNVVVGQRLKIPQR